MILRERVDAEFFGAVFPEEIAAAEAMDEALEHAAVAIELAATTIQRDGGFVHGVEFERWLATECQPDTKAAEDAAAAREADDDERRAAIEAALGRTGSLKSEPGKGNLKWHCR